MKLRLIVAVVAVALVFGMTAMYAQNNCNIIPIFINAGPQPDTVLMGIHQSGTFGIDASIGESEGPPPPVPGVHYWLWFDPSGVNLFGNGLFKYDFRASTTIDSFQIHFQPDSGYTVTFHFACTAYIGARYDSIVVTDYSSGTYLFNMATAPGDSYLVPTFRNNPKYTDFLIYAYGAKTFQDHGPPFVGVKCTEGVRLESPLVPSGFSLQQNYPNPFNPTTTVKFDIAQEVVADIAVFDVLGRKVATLASERLQPGTYSATWNGTNDRGQAVVSGVYYVRMVAHTNGVGSNQSNFSAVRKLLLMK